MCNKVFEKFLCHHMSTELVIVTHCPSVLTINSFYKAGTPLPWDQVEVLLKACRRQSTTGPTAPRRLCSVACERQAALVEQGKAKGKGRAHLDHRVG
jgi:hypothetical protein